tara:strand:+ start:614 stop:1138 length:525 start_codon:yes stop_codon:yes gene_type:complete
MENLAVSFLLPFEFILPILGILLIRNKSPFKALIYRSFLGSIAALTYALIGAPDVALTEVLVGTLLSTLIYIVAIRGCFSLVLLIKKGESIDQYIFEDLKSAFSELNFHLVIKVVDNLNFDNEGKVIWDDSIVFSGSPHAAIKDNKLFVESSILSKELSKTSSLKGKNLLIAEK